MSRIPVHVVAGFLGVGKTTALTALVASRAGVERAAIVVNDFGEAGIDATQFDTSIVQNIAGGCVCCTAPEDLVRVISELLEVQKPDRIWIEPSGLGRPRDVLDMLSRGGLAARVDLRPMVVVVDPERLDLDDPLMREQWEGGDILVINRVDLAGPAAMKRIRDLAAAMWPPFIRVIETRHGVLPAALPDWTRSVPELDPGHDHTHVHDAHCGHPSTDGFHSVSRLADAGLVWRWDTLRKALESPDIARFKGMFHSDIGWVRVDVAGGQVHVAPTPWRRDSRFDLIVPITVGLDAVLAGISAASLPAEVQHDTLSMVDPDGHAVAFGLSGLRRLPAVSVAERVPGRTGTATLLAGVLALVGARPDSRVVLCAADGMVSDPVLAGEIGDALLVYEQDGEPLTAAQGGPYRVLVPAGQSRCASIKGLVRIRVL